MGCSRRRTDLRAPVRNPGIRRRSLTNDSYSPNGVDPNSSYQGLSEDAERVFRGGWLQPAMSVALRYGLALILVSVALVLAHTFLYYGLPQPFTAFALSAIAGTFWYGGTKPGILAALISWLVRDYFFEPEVSAESRILYGLVFLVFALVMILVMRGRNELEARVAERTAELTKTNEDLTLEIARHKELKTSCVPLSITHRYSSGPTCPTDIAISSISVG